VAVALVATVILLREPNDSASLPVADSQLTADIYDAPEFDRLLGRPRQTAEVTVTLNEQTASVAEIETANEKVRIYQIN
jgi:hypothetical protein